MCIRDRLCVESPFEVASPLPEGFDDDDGRRSFVRRVGDAACKVVRASLLNYLPCSLYDVFICDDRDTNHRHPSFVGNADIDAFKERNILRRGAWPFGGRATVLEVLTTMQMSSNSRRKTEKALIVLAVTPIRPRETSSMYAKASTLSRIPP